MNFNGFDELSLSQQKPCIMIAKNKSILNIVNSYFKPICKLFQDDKYERKDAF